MFYVYAALIGLISGVTSGLFGVGGGIVMVPAMMFLMKVDIKTAIGTSLAVMVPTAAVGAFKHHHMDHVYWRLAASIIPVGLVGSYLGARLTQHISSQSLEKAFGIILILVGARIAFWK